MFLNVTRRKREALTSFTSIRMVSELGNYLGVPLISGRVKNSLFNPVLNKLQTRLASWKSNLLNKAGRVCLAQSILSSIPIHIMQSLWLPQGIYHEIEKVTRTFIWGNASGRGLHLVYWATVTSPKCHGGLGLRESRRVNVALLGKWV